jgi:ribosomal protein S12 methylthiotransferase accessory factor
MKFQNCVRNEYGKCDTPSSTISRIKRGFQRLHLDAEYSPFRVSENIYWGRAWIDEAKIVCNGKGVTPELAEASAYAELAERFSSGLFYADFEERVRFNIPALYDQETSSFLNFEWMDGYVHSHQDSLAEKHLRIEDLLAGETHLTDGDVEEIKKSHMAMHWVDGFSVISEETVKVPVNFVAYIHASNGIAAGNTLEEAMLQASCEIFERHAQIQTIKPERIVPSIDLASVESDVIQGMARYYSEKNVEVVIKDLSLDGQLPCIGVLFTNHNIPADRLEHRILLPGASFDLDEALTRCFTESMQGRETLSRARPELDRPVLHRSRVGNYYLLMKCAISLKDISFLERGETTAYRNVKIKDVFGEIEEVRNICKRFATDFIVLNNTHPVLDFPVARVIIPRVSDFLPFLEREILVSEETRPSAVWRGERYRRIMSSFFAH